MEGVVAKFRKGSLKITLEDRGFEEGKSELKSSIFELLNKVYQYTLKGSFQIKIESHTDNVLSEEKVIK